MSGRRPRRGVGAIGAFGATDQPVFEPPEGLEPWDPEAGDEIPWELRDADDGAPTGGPGSD